MISQNARRALGSTISEKALWLLFKIAFSSNNMVRIYNLLVNTNNERYVIMSFCISR
ncbi:unnamed protein product [Moneuplotes crassus]|uniref:Uncharacterized protein n=1 Tax=Euplotes crassus TaxID=5936 RepID=A0AAD2D1Q7_EUPCR|nr:unnamed protein product [Moneuplotes crassus]